MITELLPCPFCGETDVFVNLLTENYFTMCGYCKTQGPHGTTVHRACERWNERRAICQHKTEQCKLSVHATERIKIDLESASIVIYDKRKKDAGD
jgi:Lar family restriction alleviation protein